MDSIIGKMSKPSIFLFSEFGVIVLGVLVALAVDSWNSNRQAEDTRRHLIESLLSDLREDRGDYEEFIETSEMRSAAAELIGQFVAENTEWTGDQIEQSRRAFSLLGSTPRLETVDSTFREMSALGSGATLRDTSIRLEVSYYYGFARDRSDVNELLRPGILRYRASLEDIGFSFVDRRDIDVNAVMANKKTLAIIRELGVMAKSAARMAVDLQRANTDLISRLEAFQEQ